MRKRRDIMDDARGLPPLVLLFLEVLLDIRDGIARRRNDAQRRPGTTEQS